MNRPGPHPPCVPFVLAVGVTGHRSEVLKASEAGDIRSRIRDVLVELERSGRSLLASDQECFANASPQLRFVSPLADGADQIAAEVALDLGWELGAILPFERSQYRATLTAEARESLDALLARARSVLELPGDAANGLDGYVMAGRATVAHCDVLIAVWDGLPPRGRGGTAEVVQLALTRGTAVVHVPLAAGAGTRILWSAFDPTVLTLADDAEVSRPLGGESVETLLRAILLPPSDPDERQFLKRFLRERAIRVRVRIEYSLLLTATGVRRFRARDLSNRYAEAQTREEWQRFRTGCVDAHQIHAPIDLLEDSYAWADQIATHFAQTYRSGHIFNFVLGGIAVCLGLAAFMAPHFKFDEAALELVITLAIILNAIIGQKHEWHRRWLDTRQLAERLRPMRSLKLLGIAATDPPGTATNPVPTRWIDWYASGVWRAMGCPAGVIDRECAARLATAIAAHEIEPQVSYHKRNARQIELLDHRLEQIGFVLFAATLVVSVATLIGLGLGLDFVNAYGNWFTLVSAGFPALGTAVFGIRFQGDFGGDALRSLVTANTLGRIDEELRKDVTLTRAADLAEQASRIMLSDLDEWRLVNQQRDLSVG